jgi:hypothetical protein
MGMSNIRTSSLFTQVNARERQEGRVLRQTQAPREVLTALDPTWPDVRRTDAGESWGVEGNCNRMLRRTLTEAPHLRG